MASTFLRRTLCTGSSLRVGHLLGSGVRPLRCLSLFRANQVQLTPARGPHISALGKIPTLAHFPKGILQFLSGKILQATHRDMPPVKRFQDAIGPSRGPKPPRRPSGDRWRIRWLDAIPSAFIFWGIFALNGVVFFMWSYGISSATTLKDPRSYLWMRDNFLVNLKNFREGRIWTLLTACFSQESTSHLLFNGLSYYFMAPPVLALLGNTQFLALYLGAGLIASAASLSWRAFVRTGSEREGSSHGASGAIYGIISFFACLSPNTTFLLFFVIPCPAWAVVGGIFVYDGYNVLTDKRSMTDGIGHIGGLMAGAGYFALRRFGLRM